jgi:hypothetical protein
MNSQTGNPDDQTLTMLRMIAPDACVTAQADWYVIEDADDELARDKDRGAAIRSALKHEIRNLIADREALHELRTTAATLQRLLSP